MSSINTPLKYLFVAEYDDGTAFVQPANDHSINHDDSAEYNPSAFSDVDHTKLVRFHLVLPQDGQQIPPYTVDLTDGHFEAHGMPFTVHDQFFDPSTEELKLIYFRETRQEVTANPKTGEILAKRDYVNRYFIGWETTGTNKVKALIGVF